MITEDSYFYSDFLDTDNRFEVFKQYANEKKHQTYIITKALGTRNKYEYKFACSILVPSCKILIANLEKDNNAFENYYEDFIEDLGYLSDKYNYKEVLGRPREWKNLFKKVNNDDIKNEDIITENLIKNPEDIRKIELLTSLLIGSINDINRLGNLKVITTLDKVKRKVILFDGKQSDFLYKTKIKQKEIRIQGLAGTGKTELLLHKIRELYINEPESIIVFTCYNNILSDDMQNRILHFFNFMKVEEQIDWHRLKIMRAWGSGNSPNLGVYSFICHTYGIPFQRFYINTNFGDLCKKAIKILKTDYQNLEPCFDYMLIDESQDFEESFFELCSIVTKKQVFIAGDIFQNIFDLDISTAKADFILNRCYRTEPRTLMFAHAVGMGLYEQQKLRWLKDSEWSACGYIVEKDNSHYKLKRNPIKRFEDIKSEDSTLKITGYIKANIVNEVKSCIDEIKQKYESVLPDDIAIIFLERDMFNNCETANKLEKMLYENFNWNTNKGYETKKRISNHIFISNINNIKGLEFPFVIFIAENKITKNFSTRNAIYMALTRSLLYSYFFINNDLNKEFISIYKDAIKQINELKAIVVTPPTKEEEEIITLNLKNLIKMNNKEETFNSILNSLSIAPNKREALITICKDLIIDDSISDADFAKRLHIIISESNF